MKALQAMHADAVHANLRDKVITIMSPPVAQTPNFLNLIIMLDFGGS